MGRYRKASLIRFIRTPERYAGLRAHGKAPKQRDTPRSVSVRLSSRVALEADADGRLVARFDGYSLSLGAFSAAAAGRAGTLQSGLPLTSFVSARRPVDGEIDQLVRRLARHGLVEYRLARPGGDKDLAVIEPQLPDYWPRTPPLRETDVVALSRFAYLRRRGGDMVLESPRAGAIFKIRDPSIAAALAALTQPWQIKQLRRQDGFPGIEFLALLLDCRILFKTSDAGDDGLRAAEGDNNLALWDFHDLLFHARSTEGRHANPLGGLTRYAGAIAPTPAVRPRWPGKKIDLRRLSRARSAAQSPLAKLLRERRSTREFDAFRPVELAELARFLDGTARILSKSKHAIDPRAGEVEYTHRPYPSAGAGYELELYVAVGKCDGLARGFYHYDADAHALVPIGARIDDFEALLVGAQFAMGVTSAPPIVITIAARFGRVSWKYSSIAYSLVLKDVGVLLQTFYLMTAEMGLGGCAVGITNIELFARMTGIEFHVEGPVGQFALGRTAAPGAAG
jgi:SagB-type dehydrogenase family enzyme